MDDLTTKLAEALRLISFASMDRGARDTATEALRLYDAAKAQPKQAAEPGMSPKQTSGTSEPMAWRSVSGGRLYLSRHDAVLNGEQMVTPLYAAPVAQAEPTEAAVQELGTMLAREQGVYLTKETMRKYLKAALAAPQPPKEQP